MGHSSTKASLMFATCSAIINAVWFQQDRATLRTAKSTIHWLKAKGIARLKWPTKGASLSPVETFWSCLARDVENKSLDLSKN